MNEPQRKQTAGVSREPPAASPRAAASFVVALLNRYVGVGDLLVDVGCGPGLYRHVTPARFIGIDYTDATYYPDWPRSVDIVAEGSALGLKDSCADLVMSKSAFFQFPDPEGALAEFHRVLKPGGRILLFDYNRRTQKRLERVEVARRPCWTQWRLRVLVARAGFQQTELLLPTARRVARPLRLPFLVVQELIGSWAIVTGVKAK